MTTHEWKDKAHQPDQRVLLVDSDIVAFKFASVNQQDIDWGDGVTTRSTDIGSATLQAVQYIEALKENLGAEHVVICLTDKENWRKDVLPSYKANRKNVEKPELLQAVKDHLCGVYDSYIRKGLEADDCMGILSTMKTYMYGKKKIIVSEDKDMQTIPGYLFNPAKDRMIRTISQEQADYFHMYQTLIGDSTDGYTGCPGAGPKLAEEFLRGHLKYEPFNHVFARGPRKGMTEVRYDIREAMTMWETVLSVFNKFGLNEEDALVQARVARICRASDYNFKEKKVILWKPIKN
jgi:5'-3' exonuclease